MGTYLRILFINFFYYLPFFAANGVFRITAGDVAACEATTGENAAVNIRTVTLLVIMPHLLALL